MLRVAIRSFTKMNLAPTEGPVIFVLGPTGVGKSLLSINLATKFNGEILSADSMQVYRDLDIITNKVPKGEMEGIPHHLLNFVDPLEPLTVVDYRNLALPIISDISRRGKLPIVTGGTMYWIESLLYEVLITCESVQALPVDTRVKIFEDLLGDDFQWEEHQLSQELLFAHPIEPKNLKLVSSEELHRILSRVDPLMASELHPASKRKIIRSLQVYQQTGKPHSYWLKQQKSTPGGSHLGGPLRLQNSHILLLTCDKSVLDERINKRVESMIERGLVEELIQFHENYHRTKFVTDEHRRFTEGIFQSIGFKEFHQYLTLPPEKRNSPEGQKLFSSSVEEMKRATRKYAKTQIKWIRNRLILPKGRDVPNIFVLDCTNLDDWPTLNYNAQEIVKSIIKNESLPPHIKPLQQGEVPLSMQVAS